MKRFKIPMIIGLFIGLTLLSGSKAWAGVAVETVESTVVEVVDNREYEDLVIAQVNNYVNIRSLPDSEKGKVLGKLYNNSVGHFIEETENGWYRITSGSVTGYVSSAYCVRGQEAYTLARDVEITYAKVTASALRVRKQPSTSSKILGSLPRGEELVVLEELDGFAKVDFEDGVGYISLDYVELSTEFVEAESIEEEKARLAAEKKAKEDAKKAAEAAMKKKQEQAQKAAQDAAAAGSNIDTSKPLGEQVVDYALQFLGNPYVYGGTSLTKGADCSGFTQSVYKYFGISLPRTGQRSAGVVIASLSEALPGDLLFYSGHVAIYMGDGKIVHAATKKKGICIGNANFKKIVAIRRIF